MPQPFQKRRGTFSTWLYLQRPHGGSGVTGVHVTCRTRAQWSLENTILDSSPLSEDEVVPLSIQAHPVTCTGARYHLSRHFGPSCSILVISTFLSPLTLSFPRRIISHPPVEAETLPLVLSCFPVHLSSLISSTNCFTNYFTHRVFISFPLVHSVDRC